MAFMLRTAALVVLFSSLASAGVTAVRVVERSDVLNGESFGKAGPYERIIATVHYAVDPKLPANQIITDIQLAPTNAAGLVEFTGDLFVLKPREPKNGNGTIFLEINNRGGKGLLSRFNYAKGGADPRTAEEFGDKFLMERGYTLVWVGWQIDEPAVAGRMGLHSPVITDNGKTITGLVRSEIVPDKPLGSFNLGDRDHVAYEAADVNDPANTLTVRDQRDAPRQIIPHAAWKFTDPRTIAVSEGLQPGRIYEVVYTAKNPVVTGLGPAAVRDFISYLKYGTPSSGINVLGDQPRFLHTALGFGISQSGRFLRKFLYDGFNADERGRRVFDGVWADVAGAGRGSFNHRFAQPSRDAQPFTNFFYPTDVFPFNDTAYEMKQTPKIFYTNGAYEYWGRAASLIHTTPDGTADAPLAPDSRAYFLTGAQHGPGSWPPAKGDRQFMSNVLDQRPIDRALLIRLTEWVNEDTQPPASRLPHIADNQLVAPEKVAFPLKDVPVPKHFVEALRLDYTKEPPTVIGKPYPTLVPQVDADGNEIAGVR
ncbi:MAG: alpha/beta hydrolase domain-containing protein, partial [Bryobacteraceae bacterium]